MDDAVVDDLMPLDGAGIYNPSAPQEQREEIVVEKNMVLAASPLIDSILEWFDDQVRTLNTLDGVDLNKDLPLQIYGRKYASDRLREARADLEAMRDSYIKQSNR